MDLVVCSLEGWDDVWRRNQFLVRELLAGDPGLRVLFVEPPVDVLHRPSWDGRWPSVGLRPVPGRPALWRLRPVKVVPRVLRSPVEGGLIRQVLAATAHLGFSRPVLWVNDTRYADLVDRTGWPSVYDVTDDWLEASAPARDVARRQAQEARLLASAAAVTVCSPALAASRGASRPVELIPNAVDVDHFRRARARPPDLPPAPTAVYVGTLHRDRLDVDLCTELALRVPELSLVLVGPDALDGSAREHLAGAGNIRLLGPRPYDEVPAYLQHADVVVVPHVVTPFTESLDPIKAYECLAVGRPTVATPVAGFRELGPPVEATPPDQFVDAVRAALDRSDRPVEIEGLATWADRAERFAEVLGAAARSGPPAEGPTDRLHVAYLDHCARRSGGELALLRLLPALARRGVAPAVILAETGPLVGDIADAGVAVSVLPMDERARGLPRDRVRAGRAALGALIGTARYVGALRHRLRQLGPDLVHTNSLKSALYGGVAGRLAGVPVVWHVRDRVACDYLPASAVRQVRFLFRFLPSLVIANSRATAATLWTSGGEPPVHVVYDAVPQPADPPPPPPEPPLRLGIVGRIAPWKGQDLFLEAFAAAFPDGQERAVIIGAPLFGEDDFEAELHRRAAALGLGDRVEFRGFREDVAAELARLHVVVHASTVPEPFGMVVVEAMAAGRPVVAADTGGPAEVVADGVDGLLYRMGDAGALATALRRLAEDPELRSRLGAAGAQRASAFAPEAVAGAVRAAYESLAPMGRRARRRRKRRS